MRRIHDKSLCISLFRKGEVSTLTIIIPASTKPTQCIVVKSVSGGRNEANDQGGGYRNPGEVTIYPSMYLPTAGIGLSDILLLMYDDKFIRFVKTPEILINKYHDLRLIMGYIYHNVKNKSIF
jgi:hypothetical protein